MVNDVLLISASLIGGFIFAALLSENADDDDDMDGGMMIPSYNNVWGNPQMGVFLYHGVPR